MLAVWILPLSSQKDKTLIDYYADDGKRAGKLLWKRLKGWLDRMGKNLRDYGAAAVLPAN